MDVFQPVIVGLDEAFGDEAGLAVFYGFESSFGKGFHFDEPLLGDEGFDRRLAARAVTDGMGQIFDMIEES